jgi:putative ABC transport system permease protein
MSVVISLFGIANSLFLSIHERTREFGLLRAVGATRAQVRRMVRYESVITAVIGGLLGTGVGLLFAFLVTQSLDDLDSVSHHRWGSSRSSCCSPWRSA